MGKEREGKTILHSEKNSRTVSKTDSVVDSVIDQLISRSQTGKLKYNTDLDREDLSLEQWLQHAIEEQLDSALYLTKIKAIISGKTNS
jgi:hypothetical protein